MSSNRNAHYLIGFFALLKLLIPFLLIHPSFDLQRDEYLYMADAGHLAWGYIEMPPLLAVLGFISNLLGGSANTVHMWGGIFGALTVLLVGKMVLQMKGDLWAVFIACLAFLCSGFLRMHVLFQPNFLDVFFWTAASYLIICWIDTEKTKYLYLLGICFGLGMLGKYSTAFYILSFLAAVLLTDKRKWLTNKHFYFSMLAGLAILAPNLIWQFRHHFPVLHHMQLLNQQQLQYNSRIDFIISQFTTALPSFFIWLGGLWYVLMNREGRKYLLLGILYLGIIGILLYFNGKGYYAMAIYPTLMAFGGIWFSKIIKTKWFRWTKWVGPAFTILLCYLALPIYLPTRSPEKLATFYQGGYIDKSFALIWEDHQKHLLPQDFADMLSWREMAVKTANVYHSLPDSIKKQTMVYGDNYGEAGALSFYGKELGLPEIYSDDASYIFWLPEHFTQKYFLFVCYNLPDTTDTFFNHWGKREIRDSITNKYAREYNAKIVLYSQPNDSARIIAEQHIREGRKAYNYP